MEEMINTINVDYSYSHEEDQKIELVLNHVNLKIDKGEFVTILGHNGSGKSTLAKHFNALLLPAGGTVFVKHMDTSEISHRWDIRQTVGMVFQNPDNQIVATVVEEDVAFGPENLGIPPTEIRERVDYALKVVDMYEYRKHAPHLLSGGQKQRIAIAGVIAMKPECIVLDEPTAMLDPIGRREVITTIKKLNRDEGITVVLITHYMDEAVESDRIVVMEKGNIIMDGKPKEVFSQVEKLKTVGLDVPQVTELAYELRKYGIEMNQDVLTVDECVDELIRLIQN
ncbi:MAG: energy-coupling factor transport system ATP-binding protein [Petroclostridium sp.]|jgi:energy-coupling factor transport system ATP-binding protein|uniref:energy-coupling factor transporter ATPase n=1 Tax=Petroclostridium xylanilyticum TaxID=1792311 RepID=UPI000B992F53|nr:energy-coupling factor transporter ATPase [Petroclostridium xylanilyticum]MBZ4645200.1 transporter related protein [Clostridia bacterium]MDK2809732.1 energy-coupling factor transport system ATP-binding protein [Petroclostridium sp.]